MIRLSTGKYSVLVDICNLFYFTPDDYDAAKSEKYLPFSSTTPDGIKRKAPPTTISLESSRDYGSWEGYHSERLLRDQEKSK